MRYTKVVPVYLLMLLISSGCSSTVTRSTDPAATSTSPIAHINEEKTTAGVSLTQADAAQHLASERKIIRNANLIVEVEAPLDAQRKVATIAEAHHGFVVTTDSQQSRTTDAQDTADVTVEVVLRVPAGEFGLTIDELRRLGGNVSREKITGQDVTEEYIDLEARSRTQQALEAQFLEIMKSAREVKDALEVQRQIAEVRTEIERLEGRRRFLANGASLSTITITLMRAAPLVAASRSGFIYSVRQAFGDAVDTGATIINFAVRLLGVMTPIALFLILPIALVCRVLIRRRARFAESQASATR